VKESQINVAEDSSPEHFSLISFNTWRLCDPSRVPDLVRAMTLLGEDVHPRSAAPSMPDIMVFQELECPKATDSLRKALEKKYWFAVNVCAYKHSGTPRSVVGIAVKRDRFKVVEKQEIDLGRIFPDHRRCALSVTLTGPDDRQRLHLVGIHHSPHPLLYAQTETLIASLRSRGLLASEPLILCGDFNFTRRSKSYRLLTSHLHDPFPSDRGKTHWFRGRIDFIFISKGITLLRPLDRDYACRAIRPAGFGSSLSRGLSERNARTHLSDHLPEGGLFKLDLDSRD
jgi:endonuclease/exonuclease/phosphatase family metal-dependent hydrolase